GKDSEWRIPDFREGQWSYAREPATRDLDSSLCLRNRQPTISLPSALLPLSSALRVPGRRSQVVIEKELVRDRPEVDRGQLALALVGDPGLDHVRGEDVAPEQPGVVLLQGVEHLAERAGGALDLLGLLGLEVVQVLVDRLARVDLVLDAVEAGHQLGGEA